MQRIIWLEQHPFLAGEKSVTRANPECMHSVVASFAYIYYCWIQIADVRYADRCWLATTAIVLLCCYYTAIVLLHCPRYRSTAIFLAKSILLYYVLCCHLRTTCAARLYKTIPNCKRTRVAARVRYC